MMGVRKPETCWAVNKRQVIDWRNYIRPWSDQCWHMVLKHGYYQNLTKLF
jgi:hypothetical protein